MFSVVSFHDTSLEGQALRIIPFVDGVSLCDLVTAFETAKGYTDPAGGYGGIVPEFMRYGPLDDYFLARGDSLCRQDNGTQYMLGCECGEVGCWPLMGRVTALETAYRWDQFGNPFRETRDYSDFGQFLFERSAYEIEVGRLVVAAG
jgi:hypothetical protein